jgi:hypothetical protein
VNIRGYRPSAAAVMPAPSWTTEILSVGALGMSDGMTPVLTGDMSTAPLALQPLIALDALGRVVLKLALLPRELDLVDSPSRSLTSV